ncbi:hypothetical protein BJV82DRAFT_592730 [Fennellomyces sp. T-0311]|nr:hypothetical protein BJV82DRAFT_592730 [Fennellomyces sp. T-0311]
MSTYLMKLSYICSHTNYFFLSFSCVCDPTFFFSFVMALLLYSIHLPFYTLNA